MGSKWITDAHQQKKMQSHIYKLPSPGPKTEVPLAPTRTRFTVMSVTYFLVMHTRFSTN